MSRDEQVASARRSLAQLTRTTPEVQHHNGGVRIHQALPLLVELQAAVRPSGESRGAGGGSVAPGLPLAVNALDLMASITSELLHEYWLVCSANRRREGYTVIQKLEYWVERTLEAGTDEAVGSCAARLAAWVTRIEDLFDPPRIVEIPVACPACGRWRVSQERDGDLVQMQALASAVYDGSESAARVWCRGCRAEWKGEEQLKALNLVASRDPARG